MNAYRSAVWGRRDQTRRLLCAAVGAVLLVASGAPSALGKQSSDTSADAAPTAAPSQDEMRVVVMASSSGNASERVKSHHGDVAGDLPAADSVAADVTAAELAALRTDPDVVVVPNVQVEVTGKGEDATNLPVSVFRDTTGVSQFEKGAGGNVTVAVLDTGIARVPDTIKRIVGGVDLSGEGDPYKDSYGHGTFVAGLIAGNGAASDGLYVGEAGGPKGASLASIKVAGASGATDLITVINGIQWAIANKTALKIGVLNISMGTPPFPSSVDNPLDRAVEAAWRSGIVVVTSAGNTGPTNGSITSPGDDPLVITVGAIDDHHTAITADDTMTDFSAVGPTAVDGWFKPDLVAAGRSVISLRVPGSTIDLAHPTARIGSNYFVGSGTSFSAAITSGAVAILRQQQPTWGPDRIKGALLASAAPGPVGSPFVDGFGSLNLTNAANVQSVLTQVAPIVSTPVGSQVSLFISGGGSAWNGSSWNGSAWNGSAWNGSSWNGSSWNGSAWNGSSWNGSSWNGSSWNGSSWNGSSWN
ncbi:MAG: serine protease AprX [Acidimicrobiaceae bacterium]